MRKAIIMIAVIGLGAFAAWEIASRASDYNEAREEATHPSWLESDSAKAIDNRIRADFSLSREEASAIIREKYPDVTEADIDTFIARHYIEAMNIDGEQRIHRKSPRNLSLLNPEFRGGRAARGGDASEARLAYVDSVLSYYSGTNDLGAAHRVTYRFSIDVPYSESIAGDTLRVWMPVPLDTALSSRQHSVEILAAQPKVYLLSGDNSVHNTIYFTSPAPAEGDTAHFEYVGRFVTEGVHYPASEILAKIKPYDKDSDVYRRFTAFEAPHMVEMKDLARSIVGNETNPYRQSEMVVDYLMKYPWAGAREYSTIPCIPRYVVEEGHGDCGQVSLLYISLMRSLGVPARWESGWMLHPGEVNFHDWAEVYFEGVGWVPVDVSFGRYANAPDDAARTFYSHGIDSHRFASNRGIGGALFPAKRFVRSETVDFQAGEVECSKGNLFYPGWDFSFDIISVEPVAK